MRPGSDINTPLSQDSPAGCSCTEASRTPHLSLSLMLGYTNSSRHSQEETTPTQTPLGSNKTHPCGDEVSTRKTQQTTPRKHTANFTSAM